MATPTSHETSHARRRGLTVIAAVVVLGGVGWGVWHWMHARHFETTDNAYVAGNVVQITPQVGGTVLAIGASDTDFVRAGQVLVQLDATDARVALQRAEAQLAQTVREVRTVYANNAPLQAQVSLRQADLARARADAARAEDDVNRRRPLLATGAVGKEEFQHASAQLTASQSAVAAAQAAVQAAREQLTAGQTQTEGTRPQEHPNVQRAAAQLREAWLALERATLKAPVDGTVAKRGVQLGQRVAAGAPLMTLVGLSDLWVDANLKENQLARVHIGQPVELTADVYGKKVLYHGTVSGLGAGTGAAFALLPAQNATGNWIKVVQRVPVRIALDKQELAAHPLRVGLSMDASIDVSDQSGADLASTPSTAPLSSTAIFDASLHAADARVAQIVADNLGRRVAQGPVPAAPSAVQ